MAKKGKIIGGAAITTAILGTAAAAGISWQMYSYFLVRNGGKIAGKIVTPKVPTEEQKKIRELFDEKDRLGHAFDDEHQNICRKKEINVGDMKLIGYYYDQGASKTALIVHGLNSSHFGCLRQAECFFELGYNILAVDLRSHGESDGKFRTMGYLESEDVLHWIHLLVEEEHQNQIFLMGESMGSATVLTLSGDPKLPKEVIGIVEDCGFTSTYEMIKHQVTVGFKAKEYPLLNIAKWYCEHVGKFKVDEKTPLERVSQSRVPILFIHGKEDTFVPFSMEEELYDACPTEKKMLQVEGATHALSCMVDWKTYHDTVQEFVKKVEQEGKAMPN